MRWKNVDVDFGDIAISETIHRLESGEYPDGSPIRPNSVTREFSQVAAAVGLKGLHLHSLRHCHATAMLQGGVHPKIVSERLVHSSVRITLDTYSHVLPGMQEEAALKFEQGFQSAATVGKK